MKYLIFSVEANEFPLSAEYLIILQENEKCVVSSKTFTESNMHIRLSNIYTEEELPKPSNEYILLPSKVHKRYSPENNSLYIETSPGNNIKINTVSVAHFTDYPVEDLRLGKVYTEEEARKNFKDRIDEQILKIKKEKEEKEKELEKWKEREFPFEIKKDELYEHSGTIVKKIKIEETGEMLEASIELETESILIPMISDNILFMLPGGAVPWNVKVNSLGSIIDIGADREIRHPHINQGRICLGSYASILTNSGQTLDQKIKALSEMFLDFNKSDPFWQIQQGINLLKLPLYKNYKLAEALQAFVDLEEKIDEKVDEKKLKKLKAEIKKVKIPNFIKQKFGIEDIYEAKKLEIIPIGFHQLKTNIFQVPEYIPSETKFFTLNHKIK